MSAADLTELLRGAGRPRTDPGMNKENKITIIAWGGDLDRIWPTLILSTTAAASGMQASVFFTFWGLFAFVKPDVRITGDNWMQKMLSMMNPGLAEGAKLVEAISSPAPAAGHDEEAREATTRRRCPSELIETAQDLGVRLIPCQMTMDLLGLKQRGPDRRASRSRSAPPPRCSR